MTSYKGWGIGNSMAFAMILSLVFGLCATELFAQVRSGRRTTTAATPTTRPATARTGGAVVKGEDGGAAVGNRGAVVKGDEGYAAVGRGGAVVKGDEAGAAVGRGGAVVAGEEGVAAAGRHGGVVVGNRYDDYDAWRAIAGGGAAIAVGTMLAHPPSAATTVVIGGTTYWQYQNAYYARVYSGGSVVYQVVPTPK